MWVLRLELRASYLSLGHVPTQPSAQPIILCLISTKLESWERMPCFCFVPLEVGCFFVSNVTGSFVNDLLMLTPFASFRVGRWWSCLAGLWDPLIHAKIVHLMFWVLAASFFSNNGAVIVSCCSWWDPLHLKSLGSYHRCSVCVYKFISVCAGAVFGIPGMLST